MDYYHRNKHIATINIHVETFPPPTLNYHYVNIIGKASAILLIKQETISTNINMGEGEMGVWGEGGREGAGW